MSRYRAPPWRDGAHVTSCRTVSLNSCRMIAGLLVLNLIFSTYAQETNLCNPAFKYDDVTNRCVEDNPAAAGPDAPPEVVPTGNPPDVKPPVVVSQQPDAGPKPVEPTMKPPDIGPVPVEPTMKPPDIVPIPVEPTIKPPDGPKPVEPTMRPPDVGPKPVDPSIKPPDGPKPVEPTIRPPDVEPKPVDPVPNPVDPSAKPLEQEKTTTTTTTVTPPVSNQPGSETKPADPAPKPDNPSSKPPDTKPPTDPSKNTTPSGPPEKQDGGDTKPAPASPGAESSPAPGEPPKPPTDPEKKPSADNSAPKPPSVEVPKGTASPDSPNPPPVENPVSPPPVPKDPEPPAGSSPGNENANTGVVPPQSPSPAGEPTSSPNGPAGEPPKSPITKPDTVPKVPDIPVSPKPPSGEVPGNVATLAPKGPDTVVPPLEGVKPTVAEPVPPKGPDSSATPGGSPSAEGSANKPAEDPKPAPANPSPPDGALPSPVGPATPSPEGNKPPAEEEKKPDPPKEPKPPPTGGSDSSKPPEKPGTPEEDPKKPDPPKDPKPPPTGSSDSSKPPEKPGTTGEDPKKPDPPKEPKPPTGGSDGSKPPEKGTPGEDPKKPDPPKDPKPPPTGSSDSSKPPEKPGTTGEDPKKTDPPKEPKPPTGGSDGSKPPEKGTPGEDPKKPDPPKEPETPPAGGSDSSKPPENSPGEEPKKPDPPKEPESPGPKEDPPKGPPSDGGTAENPPKSDPPAEPKPPIPAPAPDHPVDAPAHPIDPGAPAPPVEEEGDSESIRQSPTFNKLLPGARPAVTDPPKTPSQPQPREDGEQEYVCVECDDSPASSVKQCNGMPGAFINLCGMCVGGSSKRPANSGMNACGACAGQEAAGCLAGCDGDRALSSDNCGRCLGKDDLSRDRCLSVTRAAPSLLDRCGDRTTSLALTGAGLKITSVAGAKCFLKRGSSSLAVGRVTAREGLLDAEVAVPARGRYRVQCEEASGAPLPLPQGPPLAVVDSALLAVTSVQPAQATVGTEVQFKATVPGATPDQMLLCALWSQNPAMLVVIMPAQAGQGSVTCARFEPNAAGRLLLRVAASETAAVSSARCAASVEVAVRAPAPALQSTLLSPDLRSLWLDFDHSVTGRPDCTGLFSPASLTLLGPELRCRFAGSRLTVMLGPWHVVRPGTKLQLVVGSGIRRAGTIDPELADPLPGLFTTVAQHPAARTAPRYRVLPLSPPCEPGVSRELRVISEDGRKLNFTVGVAFTGSAPRDQRRNLLLWRSMRDLGLNIQQSMQEGRLLVNTSQLMTGVEYRLTVSGMDVLGTRGEEREVLVSAATPAAPAASSLMVLGPESARPDAELRAEAILLTCDPRVLPPARVDYVWSVVAAGGPLPLEAPVGRVLRLPPFSMKGGVAHQLSCSAYVGDDRTKPIATGSWVVRAITRGLRAVLLYSSLTLGTTQPLELDASASRDLDGVAGPLQFSWSCEREGLPCLLPRAGSPTQLKAIYDKDMSVALLRLPAGALAVGDHVFTVTVTRGSGTSKLNSRAKVMVRVVRGTPPVLRLSSKDSLATVDPAVGLVVAGRAEGMRGRCWARWRSVVRSPGDAPLQADELQMDDSWIKFWEEGSSEYAKDVPLVLTPSQLVPGTRHRLLMEAACSAAPARPALQRAALELELNVASPPSPATLSVSPPSGQALRTVFSIRVETQGSVTTPEDAGPLWYEFGWRQAGKTRVQPLQAALFSLVVNTVLPCEGGGAECSLVPVVRVCDTLGACVSSEAEPVRVTLPAALTQEDITTVGNRVDKLLGARQFAAALVLAQGALKTARVVAGAEKRVAQLDSRVEAALLATIADMETRLAFSPSSLPEALRFLGDESSSLRDPPPSERVMAALASFKQKVLTALSAKETKARAPARRVIGGGGPGPSWPRPRRKREEAARPLSLREVEVLLRVSEHLILDSLRGDVAQTERVRMRSDLQMYVRGLCTGLDGSGVAATSSRVASLAVAAVAAQHVELKLPPFAAAEREDASLPAYVEVSDAKSAECVAASSLADLEFVGNQSWNLGERRGRAVEVQFVGGLDEVTTISLRLPVVTNMTLTEGYSMQCARWQSDHWDTEACRTVQAASSQQPYVSCDCRASGGHFSTVLAVTPPPLPTMGWLPLSPAPQLFLQGGPTPPPSRDKNEWVDVKVRPGGGTESSRLATHVLTFNVLGVPSGNLAELELRLRRQIAQQARLPEDAVTETTFERGTVTVRLEWGREELVKRGVMELTRLLRFGRLELRGMDGERLNVPAQGTPDAPPAGAPSSNAPSSPGLFTPAPAIPDIPANPGGSIPEGFPSGTVPGPAPEGPLIPFPIPNPPTGPKVDGATPGVTIPGPSSPGTPETPANAPGGPKVEGTIPGKPSAPGPGFPAVPEIPSVPVPVPNPPVGPGVEGATPGVPAAPGPALPGGPVPDGGPAPGPAPGPAAPGPAAPAPAPDTPPDTPAVDVGPDVYGDENETTKEEKTLVALVFAGSALSVVLLLAVALRAALMFRGTRPHVWDRVPEEQQPAAESKEAEAASGASRQYRDIQYPDEILAALAQFSLPPVPPSPALSPVEGPEQRHPGFSQSIRLLFGWSHGPGDDGNLIARDSTPQLSRSDVTSRSDSMTHSEGRLQTSQDASLGYVNNTDARKGNLVSSWHDFKPAMARDPKAK